MNNTYEDRANINRYIGKAADRRLAEIKGPAFAEYRRNGAAGWNVLAAF